MGKAWAALFVLLCFNVTWISVANAIGVSVLGQFAGACSIGAIFGKVWK